MHNDSLSKPRRNRFYAIVFLAIVVLGWIVILSTDIGLRALELNTNYVEETIFF